MSNVIFYYSGIDSATLTYSATETTNYPKENLQDRNKNTSMRDTSLGPFDCNLIIDLGSGITRTPDYLILGNYIFQSNGNTLITFQYSATGAFGGEQGDAFTDENCEAATLTDKLKTFTATSAYRYWRLLVEDSNVTQITSIQLANLFFGTKWEHNHDPEIGIAKGRYYESIINESAGGNRFSQITNTTKRRSWDYDFKYITAAERANWETWIDAVYAGNKYSHYPFYFSDDAGTTLYFVRSVGDIVFKEIAYNTWETSLRLEEEI